MYVPWVELPIVLMVLEHRASRLRGASHPPEWEGGRKIEGERKEEKTEKKEKKKERKNCYISYLISFNVNEITT